ncbi:hypothetical protein E3N88_41947 [Mikania micrantha]|uniref:Transposase-associated domain-containing protein n=1 Tax=Mikania micrantha TaxID=192012 RepID=A0A5N6LJ68_9ASTR|nr:hypothetical protein E3N88_41947 [Mikania micrantha]
MAVVVADDVTPTTDVVIPTNDMAGVIKDVMEERMEEDPNHDEVTGDESPVSFDELLELLQSSHPEGNKIPSSHYAAKKTLKKIGLRYESIHVCKNDCALFWERHYKLQNCHVCNESRWVDSNTKGKKIPHKVLRYFPLIPRLRRLYCSRQQKI